MAWCSDTKQVANREIALNFKQLLEKNYLGMECFISHNFVEHKLVVRSHRVGVNTAIAFARSFQYRPKLQHIDLHENLIRDKGVSSIIKELFFTNVSDMNIATLQPVEHADRFTHLNFGSNDISNEGAFAICKVLQFPQLNVRTLILGSEPDELYANKFDHKVGIEMAKFLIQNSTLQVLDLNRCQLLGKKSQEAFKCFALAFAQNKTIGCLRFGDTGISAQSSIALIDVCSWYCK